MAGNRAAGSGVADVAQGPALEVQDEEGSPQQARHLLSRRLPQRKPQTMFLRGRPQPWATIIPRCRFTLFRTEDTIERNQLSGSSLLNHWRLTGCEYAGQ